MRLIKGLVSAITQWVIIIVLVVMAIGFVGGNKKTTLYQECYSDNPISVNVVYARNNNPTLTPAQAQTVGIARCMTKN
jgi:hypothetical protein